MLNSCCTCQHARSQSLKKSFILLVVWRISFMDLLKFLIEKNWLFYRIRHVHISKKRPFDVGFLLILVEFFDFENWKVGVKGETLELHQMVEIWKNFLHHKIWLNIWRHNKIQIELESFWPVMTSLKSLIFSSNFCNSEDFNPCANDENDEFIIISII